jgi:fatty acid desaturase
MATVKQAERNISQAIKQAEVELRARFPFLNFQDTLGSVVFFGSLAGIAAFWKFYFNNYPGEMHAFLIYFITIVGIAVCTSFLHEMEHDIVHNLYFKKLPRMQDFMFLVIWIMKLHANPWFRRELHLKHHIISGQIDDAEERLIGLGLPYGLLRLATTCHPAGMLLVTSTLARDAPWLDVQRMNLTSGDKDLLIIGVISVLVYNLTMPFSCVQLRLFSSSLG